MTLDELQQQDADNNDYSNHLRASVLCFAREGGAQNPSINAFCGTAFGARSAD